MTIHDLSLKFKDLSKNTDVLLSILIVAISLSSFALGRYSVKDSTREIENTPQNAQAVQSMSQSANESMDGSVDSPTNNAGVPPIQNDGGYVASKNGTKYHLPWCGGAKQIKEENKVYFKTKEEAEKAGYSPAANCKGI